MENKFELIPKIKFKRYINSMFPGWLFIMQALYLFRDILWPELQSNAAGLVAVLTLSVFWAPVVGLMVTAIASMLLKNITEMVIPNLPRRLRLQSAYDTRTYARKLAIQILEDSGVCNPAANEVSHDEYPEPYLYKHSDRVRQFIEKEAIQMIMASKPSMEILDELDVYRGAKTLFRNMTLIAFLGIPIFYSQNTQLFWLSFLVGITLLFMTRYVVEVREARTMSYFKQLYISGTITPNTIKKNFS